MLEFIFSYFPLQLRDAYVQSLPQRRCDVICVWNLGLRVNFQNRLFLEFIDNIWPKSASTARGQESESPQDPDKWHFLAQKGEKLKQNPNNIKARVSYFEFQASKCLTWACFLLIPKYFDPDPTNLLNFHQLHSWIRSRQWLVEKIFWKLLTLLLRHSKSNQAGNWNCHRNTQKMNTHPHSWVKRMNILSIRLISEPSPEHPVALCLRSLEALLKILPQHNPTGPCCSCAWHCYSCDCQSLQAMSCSALLHAGTEQCT